MRRLPLSAWVPGFPRCRPEAGFQILLLRLHWGRVSGRSAPSRPPLAPRHGPAPCPAGPAARRPGVSRRRAVSRPGRGACPPPGLAAEGLGASRKASSREGRWGASRRPPLCCPRHRRCFPSIDSPGTESEGIEIRFGRAERSAAGCSLPRRPCQRGPRGGCSGAGGRGAGGGGAGGQGAGGPGGEGTASGGAACPGLRRIRRGRFQSSCGRRLAARFFALTPSSPLTPRPPFSLLPN